MTFNKFRDLKLLIPPVAPDIQICPDAFGNAVSFAWHAIFFRCWWKCWHCPDAFAVIHWKGNVVNFSLTCYTFPLLITWRTLLLIFMEKHLLFCHFLAPSVLICWQMLSLRHVDFLIFWSENKQFSNGSEMPAHCLAVKFLRQKISKWTRTLDLSAKRPLNTDFKWRLQLD